MRDIRMQPVREGSLHNPGEKHEIHVTYGHLSTVLRLTDDELAALRGELDAYTRSLSTGGQPENHRVCPVHGRPAAADGTCERCTIAGVPREA